MSKLIAILLVSSICLALGQFPTPSPSTANPQTVIEPEIIVQRKDWENKAYVPSPFGLAYLQTDSTFEEPIKLSKYSSSNEVDFISNNYVFGVLHKENNLGKDVDYYSYTLTGEGNSAIYNAPYFGYSLVPACKAYKNVELNVVLVGAYNISDDLVGRKAVELEDIPSWVQVPDNSKVITSSKLVVSESTCDFYEPTQAFTYCTQSSVKPNCASGFPATTVKTSPPYTPYCNFTQSLEANYNEASPSGVYGEWPAGTYTVIVYEEHGQKTDYVLHLGYKGLFEAILPYYDQNFQLNINSMPGKLAASYGESMSWLDTSRYGSYLSLENCESF